MRILIAGGPLHGKTTRAAAESHRAGLSPFLCTDTKAQAERTGRAHPGSLYAPPQFDHDWSGLSQWVADAWLPRPGPWIIEGVAVPRALRKFRAARPLELPPCDRLIWLSEARAVQTGKQAAMTKAHDKIMNEVLDGWPELAAVVEFE